MAEAPDLPGNGPQAHAWARESIRALLEPSRVALVGLSSDPAHFSVRLLRNLEASGWSDRMSIVNPNHNSVHGYESSPSLEAIPGVRPDVALIVNSSDFATEAFEQCAGLRYRAAVIYGAGFGEAGSDVGNAARVRDAIASSGTRLLGPNTIGFANYFNGAICMATGNIPADLQPGPVAIIAQSGAVAFTIASRAKIRGLGVGICIGAGNNLDLDTADYIDYLSTRADISTIAVYVEGVRDLPRLVAACQHATEAGQLVLILRGGRSGAGERMTASHTGALATTSRVFAAAVRAGGALEVGSLEELWDTTYAHARLSQIGPRVGLLSFSGGMAALSADSAESAGLEVPQLQEQTEARLGSLYPFAVPQNPYDPTGLWRKDRAALRQCISAIALDQNVDQVVVSLPGAYANYLNDILDEVIASAGEILPADGSVAVAYLSVGALTEPFTKRLLAGGVPVFDSMDGCFAAIGRLVARSRQRRAARSSSLPEFDAAAVVAAQVRLRGRQGPLDEVESKNLLQAYGVKVTAEVVAESPDEAIAACRRLGYPVVMKILDARVSHKSEIDGVRLGISGDDQARTNYDELSRQAGSAVVVQPQLKGDLEIIVGGVRDDMLGPLVIVGAGGIFAETFDDVLAFRAPVTPDEVQVALAELKVSAFFEEVRGRRRADPAAIAQVVSRVSVLLAENPAVAELDVNPLIASGKELTAVDAMVVLRPVTSDAAPTEGEVR